MIETVALFQAMKWILEIFGCKHKIICYNKSRKGNRHRVVGLDWKTKPSRTGQSTGEVLLY